MKNHTAACLLSVLVASLLTSVSAFAQGPAVNYLTFTQGPNGAAGTKVDIFYELDSPNGNCTVTGFLSKDNGATFTVPITAATGDIGANVAPGTGKHIVWNVFADAGALNVTQAKIRLVADDGFLYVPPPSVAMLTVAGSSFNMGRRSDGDDQTYGDIDELPVHSVTLGAYQIGEFDVTNDQFAKVLGWAKSLGHLLDSAGNTWTGTGDIYAGGPPVKLVFRITDPYCNIQYQGGLFSSKLRAGLPNTTYPMFNHPVVSVSWYGAVAFCNWLSQWAGLTPCYNLATWTLTVAPPTSGGYRLPTEAEWERAAAWDGTKHWIYGFTSDTLTGQTTCNYYIGPPTVFVNPLGLVDYPDTSPVGWFNGTNISTNGNIHTANSTSPSGCYDMSGEVCEWVNDWYGPYAGTGQTNPLGAPSGTTRVTRGGSWDADMQHCRTAVRLGMTPDYAVFDFGFRVARS